MVSVERDFIPGFVHQAISRHPARLVVTGIRRLCAGCITVVAQHDVLITRAQRQQQPVIQHTQRIAQQPALNPGTGGGERIAVISASQIGHRHWRGLRIVNIHRGRRVFRIHRPGDVTAAQHGRIPYVDLMRHHTGIKVAADSAHPAVHIVDGIGIQAARRGVAIDVVQLRRAVNAGFMGVLHAKAQIAGPVIR